MEYSGTKNFAAIALLLVLCQAS